jgi:glyoxylase-like metal-dependent hydrolase (beta-lactamase superfamily II)
MAELRIRPLNCGTIHTDYSNMVYWTNFGTKIDIPSFVYLIEGSDKKIVVDTSYLSPERGGAPWPATRAPGEEVKSQIEGAGWKCEDVEILILTHLHWDHSQNCDLFPNAVKYVWAQELQYSICPVSLQAKPYDAPINPGTRWPMFAQQGIIFEPIWKDETEIAPGVLLFHTPGHTPGHCSVAVETKAGTYVLAADVIQIKEGLDRRVPAGQMSNMRDAVESIHKCIAIASEEEFILPGHERSVLEKTVYP